MSMRSQMIAAYVGAAEAYVTILGSLTYSTNLSDKERDLFIEAAGKLQSSAKRIEELLSETTKEQA